MLRIAIPPILARSLSVLLSAAAVAPLGAASLEQIRSRGSIVAVSFPHQQSAFVRTNLELGPTPALGSAEHFMGIDVDLMRAFADTIGVTLEIRRVSEPSYGALIPDLLAGKGDLVASSMTITEKRLEQVNFTKPYFSVYPVIVTRADSPATSLADLENATAAIMSGSSQEQHLRRLGVTDERILATSFTFENFASVASDKVDFTLVDSSSAARVLPKLPGLKVAFRLPGEEHYGFAVRKGDDDLLEALNLFLDRLVASGELQRIIDRHITIKE